MIEIFIDNKRIDLFTKDAIALTKQINDIAEIQKRQSDFTNRFTVPITPNNRMIAEFLNTTGNQSVRGYKYASARILSNGIPITQTAIAMITETINRSGYTFVIYAGNYDLFSKIEGKYINDLDFTDVNHTFDSDTWIGSWTNTDGFIYPIAETMDGRLKTVQPLANDVDIRFQVPHIFVKTLWNKIFTEANLEYYGDFFSTDVKFPIELVVADNCLVDEQLNRIRYVSKGDALNPMVYPFTVKLNEDPNSLYNGIPRNYKMKESGIYKLKIHYEFDVLGALGVSLAVAINGTLQVPMPSVTTAGCGQENVIIDFEREFNLKKDDVIAYAFAITPRGGCGSFHGYEVEHEMETTFEGIGSWYGYDIDFAVNLPKILQIDFLKAIMQQYGLLYQVDLSGKYEFRTIESVLNGDAGTIDLTSKFSEETSETYMIGNIGQKNKFTYQYNPADRNGSGYADHETFIDIDNINIENSLIDSIIESAGDHYFWNNFRKIASYNTFENTESDELLPAVWRRSSNADKLKTVLLNYTNGMEIDFYDSDVHIYGSSYTIWNIPHARFEKLWWSEIVDNYYQKYIALISKPVVKKVKILFNPVDIYFLDMFKIVYIEKYQSFFYLNKVNNFMSGKITECEIVKIN